MTVEFQAIILAGYGQRMHTLTENNPVPKALFPIANKPMIAHVLNWLEAAGIANILVAAQQNGASKIVNYVTKIYENQMVGTQIEVITTSAYDTADVLRQIKDKIHTDFIVVSCDLLTDAPLSSMIHQFRLHRPAALVMMAELPKVETPIKEDSDTRLFVGLDAKNESIAYLKAAQDIYEDEFSLSTDIIRKFSTLNLYTTLKDVHAYIFQHWVLDFLSQQKDILSIREELLPLLVKLQTRKSLQKSKQIAQVLMNNTDKTAIDLALEDPTAPLFTQTSPQMAPASVPTLTDTFRARLLISTGTAGSSQSDVDSSTGARGSGASGDPPQPAVHLDAAMKQKLRVMMHFPCLSSVNSPQAFSGYCVRVNTIPWYAELNRQLVKSVTERIATTADIHEKTQIGIDSMCGESTKLSERTSVKKSVIGAHCTIGKNVKLVNCLIMDYVNLEDGVKLEGCIICNGATIKSQSNLRDCEVGAQVVVEASTQAKGEHFIESRN